jgi:hypothetical protein
MFHHSLTPNTMHYAVSVPGRNGEIFTTREQALTFISCNPGCYLRTCSSLREASEFISPKPEPITKHSTSHLSIPSCTVIEIKSEEGKYTALLIPETGKRITMSAITPSSVKSPSIISIIAMYQMMEKVEGNIKFVCKDPTLMTMYRESHKWITYTEKGIFSELISATFKTMRERKIEFLSSLPPGM